MKLSKLLLAVVGATVLLGAVASSASAGRLSFSSNSLNATWTRMIFTGGIDSVECEVIINKSLHSRNITKIRLALIGYVTAANVIRCARGGATILRERLPWHIRYDSFVEALPNIAGIRTILVGSAIKIREPFGFECLTTSTPEEPIVLTYNLSAGVIQSAAISWSARCGGFTGTLSGTTSSITQVGGARVTVTLI
ncbi:MAG TPA: hypothetical protein VGO48_10640 [Conexibacter sp.]|jgi:hypothetical protein|nr:hypothetical protein [Conexibacter sp.]